MFDNMKIQKPPALLIIVGILTLPIVLLANSSSGAPNHPQKGDQTPSGCTDEC
jgi:hypothetical protein